MAPDRIVARIARRAVLAAALLAVATVGCGMAGRDPGDEPRAALWTRWERSFTAEGDADGQRVELLVEFTSPGGATRTVRGFWDGGATWRVRFMPDEPGRWSYRTTSVPSVPGLDGVTGTFLCEPNGGGTPFLEHGPVRVAASGTYLEHADGTPFFWLVDTSWNGALLSDSLDWETYLADRAAKGFSGVQFVTTQWRAAEANAEGLVAYRGYEEIEIDPAFFRRLDARIDAIERHGLLAVPVLLWALGDPHGTPGQLPESEAIRLARYILARYGAHHVVVFLGGDGNYSGDNAARWRRIGDAVFDLPGHPPAVMHPGGRHWPYDEWRDVPWLAITGYQSGHGDDAATLRWLHSGPPATKWREEGEPLRPFINLEPPYEDHVAYQSRQPHTAYTVRRALYWSVLVAPTAGTSYGAHGIWSWQTEPGTPLNHPNAGEARVWREAMAFDGSTHAGLMAGLFRRLPWWRLRPDPELVVVEVPEDDDEAAARHVAAARTPEGDAAVIYLPVGGRVVVRTERLAPGAAARWFDPRTGEEHAAAQDAEGGFVAPDGEDRVLVIASPLPPPR